MVNTRLLVVLDDSVASRRAVKYVAKFVGKRRAFRICLVHVLPPLPPELLEHGGSEDPAKEAQLEADLKVEQHRWISAGSRLPGFTSYSATICQKNSFTVAKGSVFGPLNDPGLARAATATKAWPARPRIYRQIGRAH